MQKTQSFTTSSFAKTQKVAEDFAKNLKGGEVICLYGDLGFGKTTFTQGLAKGMGVTGRIISPTFIIMRSYSTTFHFPFSTFNSFYHVDLYRISKEEEIVEIGLLDIMNDPQNIVAIEWPEKMGKLLPEKRIEIKFEYIDEDIRRIKIIKK